MNRHWMSFIRWHYFTALAGTAGQDIEKARADLSGEPGHEKLLCPCVHCKSAWLLCFKELAN